MRDAELGNAGVFAHWTDVVTFEDEGPGRTVLARSSGMTTVMVGLRAGQVIAPHHGGAASYHILDGAGVMTVDETAIPVQAGVTVTVPRGVIRGIRAETQMAFLASRETSPLTSRRTPRAAVFGILLTMGSMAGLLTIPLLMSRGQGGVTRILALPVVGIVVLAGAMILLYDRWRGGQRGSQRHGRNGGSGQ